MKYLEKSMNPTKILVYAFLFIILLGALLLTLPYATTNRESVGFLDALFTATSAVCVTGLVVVDTSTVWSHFGQVVILILIQIGGIGVMTAATIAPMFLGHRFSLKDRLIIKESLGEDGISGVFRITKSILMMTFLLESLGALFLSFSFVPIYGWARGIYYSIFHAVSAFCNAGFDLVSASSLVSLQSDFSLMLPLMLLIVIGGLGFSVLIDIRKNGFGHLSLHSKVVLIMTAILILGGMLFFFLNEFSNPETLGPLGLSDKLEASLFQSITTRTAGFASLYQSKLSHTSLLLTEFLMFVGGSPGSTAGGIKTATLALLIFTTISVIRGKEDTEILKRRIKKGTVNRAIAVLMIALSILVIAVLLLVSFEKTLSIASLSFEVVSALGTVGLSTGITASLSAPSKLVLITCMFFGRVGPMTILFSLVRRSQKTADLRYPEGRIFIS